MRLAASLRSVGGRGQRCWSAACAWDTSSLPTQALHSIPGKIKLAGEGGTPNSLMMLGELKSSISSLNRIPLTGDSTLEPKLQTGWVRQLCPAQPCLAPPGPRPTTNLQLIPCEVHSKCSTKVEPQFPIMRWTDGSPPLGHGGSPGPPRPPRSPYYWLMVLVADTALPSSATTDRWAVPPSSCV